MLWSQRRSQTEARVYIATNDIRSFLSFFSFYSISFLQRYMNALRPDERINPRVVKVKSSIDFNESLTVYV
jgi:hypothetical protein